jgi:hypothetical protein
VAVLGALGVGSAIIIPLKFAWDELSNRAASRREIDKSMRDRLHAYVEAYYAPMAFALRDVSIESAAWAKELTRANANQALLNPTVLDRWLYSAAQVARIRKMRQAGGSWFFRSRAGEALFGQAFRKLRAMIDRVCEYNGNERSLLASALEGTETHGFLLFQSRVVPRPTVHWPRRQEPDDWERVREMRARILNACAHPRTFEELDTAAISTHDLLLYYATQIYDP